MPSTIIYELNKVKIKIRMDDHFPAHFHVIGPDFQFSVSIETFEIIAGT